MQGYQNCPRQGVVRAVQVKSAGEVSKVVTPLLTVPDNIAAAYRGSDVVGCLSLFESLGHSLFKDCYHAPTLCHHKGRKHPIKHREIFDLRVKHPDDKVDYLGISIKIVQEAMDPLLKFFRLLGTKEADITLVHALLNWIHANTITK